MQETFQRKLKLHPAFSHRSPLRYPGGKTRAVDILASFIPESCTELVSPFFGGGSLELFLSATGIRIIGYDVFIPLVEFWQALLEQPAELADAVQLYHPLSKEKFYELQKKQMHFENRIHRAAAFFVLNRSSFSGSTLSGGMSPGHPRFTLSSIEKIRGFRNGNTVVRYGDFKASLANHPHMFAYLDPPYLIRNTLYGRKGNTHRNFDHEGLADILKNRSQWILSYNDNPVIREMYSDHRIIIPEWKYGMSSDKNSREMLIFSK